MITLEEIHRNFLHLQKKKWKLTFDLSSLAEIENN